jgi:uncharacterized protein YicC (UPF0701 family)
VFDMALEGQALAAELSRRLDAVQALKAQIAHRAPEQAVAYRTRLEARMRELLGASVGNAVAPET